MNRRTAEFLSEKGVEIIFDDPEQITHAKLLIIDDSIIIGSVNWGYTPFFKYNNSTIIVDRREITEAFSGYFTDLKNKFTGIQTDD